MDNLYARALKDYQKASSTNDLSLKIQLLDATINHTTELVRANPDHIGAYVLMLDAYLEKINSSPRDQSKPGQGLEALTICVLIGEKSGRGWQNLASVIEDERAKRPASINSFN